MSKTVGVLFLNPRAGSVGDEGPDMRALAKEHGLRVVEVVPNIDLRAVVRDSLEAGLRTFVVAGGDGSIHHVAQALVGTEGILGVVPVGTVNHFARDLDLPIEDWRASFDIAVRGPVRQIDVGRVNGRYFMNSIMVGLYPTVSEYRERFRSMHSRWRAYMKAARLAMRHFPHVNLIVELDGRVEKLRTQMFVVAVNAYDLTATGLVSPKTTFNDGRLAVYSLSFMSRFQFMQTVAKYLRGKIMEVEGFRRVRTQQLRVDTGKRRLRIALDGELVDMETPLQIVSVPASLLVRAPAEREES